MTPIRTGTAMRLGLRLPSRPLMWWVDEVDLGAVAQWQAAKDYVEADMLAALRTSWLFPHMTGPTRRS